MSFRSERILALSDVNHGNYATTLSKEERRSVFLEILYNGMHGLCFSIYEDGQKPGDVITYEQVKRRVGLLRPYTGWLRSFSCIEGNEHVPRAAKELGMQTLVGAWLGKDKEDNDKEIQALIALCKEGLVDIAAVGNEVLYRGDLTEDELLDYIRYVKQEVKDIPVGYVDAYYEFGKRPQITALCDIVLANCYPFWEGCPIEDSLVYLKKMYNEALAAAGGKQVLITETGWPSKGEPLKGAMPSEENALNYFINAQQWASDADINMFYFASFDESWKVGDEGEVGAYWGIWDKNEQLKFVNH